eukprot:9106351-Lingulodinium_polyedra.AAC.1
MAWPWAPVVWSDGGSRTSCPTTRAGPYHRKTTSGFSPALVCAGLKYTKEPTGNGPRLGRALRKTARRKRWSESVRTHAIRAASRRAKDRAMALLGSNEASMISRR